MATIYRQTVQVRLARAVRAHRPTSSLSPVGHLQTVNATERIVWATAFVRLRSKQVTSFAVY